jgi:hypothetical protein
MHPVDLPATTRDIENQCARVPRHLEEAVSAQTEPSSQTLDKSHWNSSRPRPEVDAAISTIKTAQWPVIAIVVALGLLA